MTEVSRIWNAGVGVKLEEGHAFGYSGSEAPRSTPVGNLFYAGLLTGSPDGIFAWSSTPAGKDFGH